MMHLLAAAALSFLLTFAILNGVVVLLVVLTHFGPAGRRAVDLCCKAPLLDLLVASFTWLPWLIGYLAGRWAGLLGSLIGEAALLGLFCVVHESMHPRHRDGPRIVKFINRSVGRWKNGLALWLTLLALPAFWMIRFTEYFVYLPLPALLGFPKYKQAEWVNVSRQKFNGLIGHDLVWCLYCDWMTGVYSLGAEVLRNVESFWCPIRFYDGKKCENCKQDFPDIDNGWVPANGSMADVEALMENKYGSGQRGWFGHPTRLTIKGQDVNRNV